MLEPQPSHVLALLSGLLIASSATAAPPDARVLDQLRECLGLAHLFPGDSSKVKAVTEVAKDDTEQVYLVQGPEKRFLVLRQGDQDYGTCSALPLGKLGDSTKGKFFANRGTVEAVVIPRGDCAQCPVLVGYRYKGKLVDAKGFECTHGAKLAAKRIFDAKVSSLVVYCNQGVGGLNYDVRAYVVHAFEGRPVEAGSFKLGTTVIELQTLNGEPRRCTWPSGGKLSVAAVGPNARLKVSVAKPIQNIEAKSGTGRTQVWVYSPTNKTFSRAAGSKSFRYRHKKKCVAMKDGADEPAKEKPKKGKK